MQPCYSLPYITLHLAVRVWELMGATVEINSH